MTARHILRRIVRFAAVLAACVAVVRMTSLAERLFYYPEAGPTPAPSDPPGAESVWFESADGTRLHGWFLPAAPGAGAGDRPPSVLHVHGNAGNIESHRWFSEHLPEAGINVLLFDFRGYGQSEGRATRRGPLIDDTEAALEALLGRPDVDPIRIGMYGQSLGGGIAVNVAARRPEVRALVLESPFASWREIAANALGGTAPAWPARLLARLLISDADRPLDAIARLEAPVLLLHGDADSIVPIGHSRRLAAAAANATLLELVGGEHNTLRDSHPGIDRTMVEFFREHLE